MNEEQLIKLALDGDKDALGALLEDVRDMVFNLSLRMLGMIADAEDATQEILMKVMTHLSSFRMESGFSTWVFRIAVNHLKDYKKHMFAQFPLSFEYYGEDIASGRERDVPDMSQGVEEALLEEELKLSCTNVMLQCMDKDSRCIFILGTMFFVDSRIAADILDITPEAYRKRLSRIREKMAAFMEEYCGLTGKGMCSCKKRIHYAAATHRLNPLKLDYQALEGGEQGLLLRCKNAMETVDDLSFVYSDLPYYKSGAKIRAWVENLVNSESFKIITQS